MMLGVAIIVEAGRTAHAIERRALLGDGLTQGETELLTGITDDATTTTTTRTATYHTVTVRIQTHDTTTEHRVLFVDDDDLLRGRGCDHLPGYGAVPRTLLLRLAVRYTGHYELAAVATADDARTTVGRTFTLDDHAAIAGARGAYNKQCCLPACAVWDEEFIEAMIAIGRQMNGIYRSIVNAIPNGLPTGKPPVGVRGWASTGEEAEAQMAAAAVDAESCTGVATAPIVLAKFLRRWISSFFHCGMTFGSRAPPLPPPTDDPADGCCDGTATEPPTGLLLHPRLISGERVVGGRLNHNKKGPTTALAVNHDRKSRPSKRTADVIR
uniref:Uncharacterized protein n=1 Tax=Anopheles farauti TaxID=69004 RepID=A0A182Q9S0_9DIPT